MRVRGQEERMAAAMRGRRKGCGKESSHPLGGLKGEQGP